MKQHLLTRWFAVLAAAMAIATAACGGGTDGTGAVPPPTTAVTSSGAMTKGSVILNGTHFDAAGASVTDDRGRTQAELDSGMVIKLRGRSDDGVSGIADQIDVENEARGNIQSIDLVATPRRFTVLGLVVAVDPASIFVNVAGVEALAAGMRVEVHGLRDSSGALRATRIEAVGPNDGSDELRGAVTKVQRNNNQFTLNGSLLVAYAGASFAPAGASEASLTPGRTVEVRGRLLGNTFLATRVAVADLEDSEYEGKAGEKRDVEGFISGFSVHPGVFQVNDRTVRTTAETKFNRGSATDLRNDAKVEISGRLDSQGVIVATKVKFDKDHDDDDDDDDDEQN
jgi:hypothetical protein